MDVQVSGGTVTFTGVTTGQKNLDTVMAKIGALEGVGDVKNDVHVAAVPVGV